MISEPDFTSRVEKLIASGIDPRAAGIVAILDHGLENGSITAEEKDVAITALQAFLSAHPGFSFTSPREKYRTSHKNGGREGAENKSIEKENGEKDGTDNKSAAEENELWSTIQPKLDKAQKTDGAP